MSLTLHYHPLSSFCHKVLIALYENDTAFTPQLVDLSDEGQRKAFRALWPIGKFPVLRDEARGETVPESTVIIDYLDMHRPGATRFVPADAEAARRTRQRDRFIDLYIHLPMQKIIGDRLRPEGRGDAHGVEEARRQMRTALDILEAELDKTGTRGAAGGGWGLGADFGLADCSAAPALFYADMVMPLAAAHPRVAAYLDRLKTRPSYARTLKEAEPYFSLIPRSRE